MGKIYFVAAYFDCIRIIILMCIFFLLDCVELRNHVAYVCNFFSSGLQTLQIIEELVELYLYQSII